MGPTTENRKSCNSNPGSCPARAHPGGTGPGALLSCGLALSLLLTTYYLHPHPLFFQLTIPFIQQPFTQKPLLSLAGALVAGAVNLPPCSQSCPVLGPSCKLGDTGPAAGGVLLLAGFSPRRPGAKEGRPVLGCPQGETGNRIG